MNKVHNLIAVIAACFALILPIRVVGQQVDDRDSTLTSRILSLQTEGKFADALELAKERLALRRADSSSAAYKVPDAERIVSDLEFIVGLPREARQELAEAYRLTEEMDQHIQKAEYDEGVLDARKQLGIVRKVLGSEHADVAMGLAYLAIFLEEKRDYAAAEPLYREALEISRKALHPDHPDVATSLNNLGLFLRVKGDYAGAEPLFREALKIRRAALGPDHLDVATSLHDLGLLLDVKGDYTGAKQVYREALMIRRRVLGPNHSEVGYSLGGLAVLLQTKGDYAGAEPLFRESLKILRESLGPNHPNVARGLRNLAVNLAYKGDFAEAEPLFRESLGILRAALGYDHPGVAGNLYNLASLLKSKGDLAGAEQLSREALEIWQKALGPDSPDVARGLQGLAVLLQIKGDNAGAEPLFREALEIRRKALGPGHPDVALCLRNLAVLLKIKGDYAEAESLYREALEIHRKGLGPDHPLVAVDMVDLAALYWAKGDYAGAERELSQAAEVYEVCRGRVGRGIERGAFQASPYKPLAAARLEQGKMSEAWPAFERSLGRVLIDLLVDAESRPLTQAEAAREDSLNRVLGDLERKVAAYQKASITDTTGTASKGFDEARGRLIEAEAAWAEFQGEMAEKYPIAMGQPCPLNKVQEGLSHDTAILGWLDGEGRTGRWVSWAYLIRSKGPVVWARFQNASDSSKTPFLDNMRVYRDLLASSGSAILGTAGVLRVGKERWSERLAPLAKSLKGIKHLIVIPSGGMLGIPVEALADDQGRSLLDQYDISYIPSATIYTWLKERSKKGRSGEATQSLLVGDPPFQEAHLAAMEQEGGIETECLGHSQPSINVASARYVLARNSEAMAGLCRLPCTRMEVQTIASVLPQATVLVGPEASEQTLVAMADRGDLRMFKALHFATHGFVDDERPERSALILSQANLPDPLEAAMAGTRIYDGLVTAEQIVREWKLDADLVALSACETGLGKVVGGEGYVGFAHAFLQAGAQSLLVSLWKVEDRATSLLMQRFYENWTGRYRDERHDKKGKPMSKAEALQEAKQYVRAYTDENEKRPFEHPYFWSAFILIGNRD